jgi:hypothetical protein
MDGDRFDRLTRSLLTGASRRSLLVGLFGGAAATIAGAELLEARKGGKGRGKGRGKAKGKGKGGNGNGGNGNGNGGNGNGNGNGGGGDNGSKRTICHCPPGNPDNCHTIRVGSKAADAHLRNHPGDTEGACDDDGQDQCLPVTGTEGDVEATDDGFTLTTEGDAAHGNLVFDVPDGTTFAELESIVADYDFATTDTCGGGAPRFVVFLENGNCPYAQFPDNEDCEDGQGTTGNLIGNNDNFVWIDDLCGGNSPVTTYDEVLADYGDEPIESIILVVDESPQPGVTEKTVTVDVCITVAADDDDDV